MIVISRAILNQSDVDDFILKVQTLTDSPDVKKWLARHLRRFIINEYDKDTAVQIVKLSNNNYPKWVKDALVRGELYSISIKQDTKFFNLIKDHLIHYLNTLTAKQLSGLQWDKALDNLKKWEKKLEKRGLKAYDNSDIDPTTVKQYPNGWSWKELLQEVEIFEEGARLANCLRREESGANFARQVNKGTLRIFSLRDKHNRPHVSIGYRPKSNEIIEIKGKNNDEPKERYVKPILDFLNKPPKTVAKIKKATISKYATESFVFYRKFKHISEFDRDNLQIPNTFLKKHPKYKIYVIPEEYNLYNVVGLLYNDEDKSFGMYSNSKLIIINDGKDKIVITDSTAVCFVMYTNITDNDKLCEILNNTKFKPYSPNNNIVKYKGIYYTKNTVDELVGTVIDKCETKWGTGYWPNEDDISITADGCFGMFCNRFKGHENLTNPILFIVKNNRIIFQIDTADTSTKRARNVYRKIVEDNSLNSMFSEFIKEGLTANFIIQFGLTMVDGNIVDIELPNDYSYTLDSTVTYDVIYGNEIKVVGYLTVKEIIANAIDLTDSIYDEGVLPLLTCKKLIIGEDLVEDVEELYSGDVYILPTSVDTVKKLLQFYANKIDKGIDIRYIYDFKLFMDHIKPSERKQIAIKIAEKVGTVKELERIKNYVSVSFNDYHVLSKFEYDKLMEVL